MTTKKDLPIEHAARCVGVGEYVVLVNDNSKDDPHRCWKSFESRDAAMKYTDRVNDQKDRSAVCVSINGLAY